MAEEDTSASAARPEDERARRAVNWACNGQQKQEQQEQHVHESMRCARHGRYATVSSTYLRPPEGVARLGRRGADLGAAALDAAAFDDASLDLDARDGAAPRPVWRAEPRRQ